MKRGTGFVRFTGGPTGYCCLTFFFLPFCGPGFPPPIGLKAAKRSRGPYRFAIFSYKKLPIRAFWVV